MSPEDVQNEIKLIFARACAEALKDSMPLMITHIKKEDRAEFAAAVGKQYATSFSVLTGAFTANCHAPSGRQCSQPSTSHVQPNDTQQAASQSTSEAQN